MAKDKEKELAQHLYIYTDLLQKDIAQKVGVSEKTLVSWISTNKWDSIKNANQTTNLHTVNNLRQLLLLQTEKNKDKMALGEFSKNDADTLLELAKTIDTLEGGIPLRMYIQVMEEFMHFIPVDKQKLKQELATLQIAFLTSKAH